MRDLNQEIAKLSPKKRALLESLLIKNNDLSVKEQGIPRREESESYPLSFAQQRLWFLDQFYPDSAMYNISSALLMKGALHVEALQNALNAIVARHESLRTTFASVDGIPNQVIAKIREVDFSVTDLSSLEDSEREAEVQRLLEAESRRPFDLSNDLMLRSILLKLSAEEHIFLVVIHHIASDGWSMGVFRHELSALYGAFSAGKPSPLPDLPIQYADFAVWQREWLQGETLEAQISYWRNQLDGAPPILELPTDRPRPAIQTHRGAAQSLSLSTSLTDALKALSNDAGVTLFMTLLTAFKVLLYRHTGQSDIVVGIPIANRNRAEIEDLIGFFVNTLIIRTDLSDNPSFLELLERVRDVCLGAYDNQDLPFEKLVAEMSPERNLGHSPLFQVMFSLAGAQNDRLELLDLTVNPLKLGSDTAKFDLALTMKETAEGLRASVSYNTDLFDTDTITRMLGHLQVLLEGIAVNPQQCVSDLPLLTESERHQLLVEWSGGISDYPRDKCVHHLFEACAEQRPDAVAVVFNGKQLTYGELNRRANQLAHHLQALGVGPEIPVAISVERSLEMVVGIMGVLKAGGAYVPMDPMYPGERLTFMIEDTQAPVLLTQERLLTVLPEQKIRVICLDRDWDLIAQESEENPMGQVKSDNLAYIIYTSGSTGKPKGVMITHLNVVGFIYSFQEVLLVPEPSQRIGTSVATFSFDVSVEEMFSPLCFGGAVHLVGPEHSTDVEYFANYLVEHKITTAYILPDFVSGVARNLAAMRDLPHFRCMLTGLAPKKQHVLQSMRDVSDEMRILNGYGPTEVTYGATAFEFDHATDPERDVPIGKPYPNYKVYVLDANMQPVPVGVPGELLIGGVGTARGYLNRPELTAEAFVPDPFSEDPDARLYRTGDMARYLPDGNIDFLGRADNQVKIGGFRIELGEIETALGQHSGISRIIVLAREDTPGNKRLVAYIVPHEKDTLTIEQLRDFLKKKLPEHMIPSIFIFLEALPLLLNGKVDRNSLPAPDQSRPVLVEAFVAPRDQTEIKLAEVWKTVLGIDSVGVKDNFFNLGGHSILAVRLFNQIQRAFGKSLPLTTLFQTPTIEGIANVLRQEGPEEASPLSCLVEIQPDGSKLPLFCIHGCGGEVLAYRELAQHLSPERPVYALRARGIYGEERPHEQFSHMAACYIKEIQAVQPQGPYLLAGAGAGGLLALEVAQQLLAQDQEVALLIMIDVVYHPKSQLDKFHNSRGRPIYWRANMAGADTSQDVVPKPNPRGYQKSLLHYTRSLIYYLRKGQIHHPVQYRLRKLYWKFAYSSIPQRVSFIRRRINYIDYVRRALARAEWNYYPKSYPGRISYFLSEEREQYFRRNEWQKMAPGRIEIRTVPGGHGTVLKEPNVGILAEHIKTSLDSIQVDD